jgi:hypothetical protein
MTDQRPTRRPAPLTQRDGSALANSNCRMTAIAVGIDYETAGDETSTGSRMRSYQDDQSGGTDSGDAKQAWARGYDATLIVRDGDTFGDALEDLRAGRLVHLDIWAAAMAGGCRSGSGEYGHTIAVLPDLDGTRWLVCDPWCSPPKWTRVEERELREGAESWGSRVFSQTAGSGLDPRSAAFRRLLAEIAHRLMSERHPGNVRDLPPADEVGDTGGGIILYTTTHVQPLEGADMGPTFTPTGRIGVATVDQDGANLIATSDGRYIPVELGYVRNVTAQVEITDGPYAGATAYLVSAGGDESGLLLAELADYVPDPDGDTDPLEAMREQYDADAAQLLGPRP